MRNRRTKPFKQMFSRLPKHIQVQAAAAFKAFRKNPGHPALRRHRLKDNSKGSHQDGSFSVTIDMQYRAIYVVDGDTNVWYWIGSHSDYDKFTGG